MSKIEKHVNILLDDMEQAFSDLLVPLRGAFKESIFSHPGFRSDGERYSLEVEVPGFTVDDLEIDVVDRAVRVKGTHDYSDGRKKTINNVYTVPSSANIEEFTAGLESGILTLSMPVKKIEKKIKVKKIEIKEKS